MFDIGFSELLVIAVVALIVIGPERLPKVARTLGLLFGRMQRYVNDVKADINREMQFDELKKLQAEMEQTARGIETSVTQEVRDAENELNRITSTATSDAGDAGDAAPSRPADAPPAITVSEAPPSEQLALDLNAKPAAGAATDKPA